MVLFKATVSFQCKPNDLSLNYPILSYPSHISSQRLDGSARWHEWVRLPLSYCTLASWELVRPIQRSITRHSAMQVDSQQCLWPPNPAPCHNALKTQISSQLVLSLSESPSTIEVILSTRATIAVQPNLADGSHIARSCPKWPEMTRHLLIAVQPRHAEASHLVEMRSNHLVYDSTAHLPKTPSSLPAIQCSFIAKPQVRQSPPHSIQIKNKKSRLSSQGKCETQLDRHCWLRVEIYEIVDSWLESIIINIVRMEPCTDGPVWELIPSSWTPNC